MAPSMSRTTYPIWRSGPNSRLMRPRRVPGSGEEARQPLAQDGLGIPADLPHEVRGRLDALDESGRLADHDRAAIRVAGLRGLAELGAHLHPPPAQLVVAPDPLLDEA